MSLIHASYASSVHNHCAQPRRSSRAARTHAPHAPRERHTTAEAGHAEQLWCARRRRRARAGAARAGAPAGIRRRGRTAAGRSTCAPRASGRVATARARARRARAPTARTSTSRSRRSRRSPRRGALRRSRHRSATATRRPPPPAWGCAGRAPSPCGAAGRACTAGRLRRRRRAACAANNCTSDRRQRMSVRPARLALARGRAARTGPSARAWHSHVFRLAQRKWRRFSADGELVLSARAPVLKEFCACADGADHQPAVKMARPGVAVRAGSREALSAPRVVARGRPQLIEAAQGAAASASRERHRRLIDRGTARLNRTSPAPTVTDV